MTSLALLTRPSDGDEFENVEALAFALDNWAVKDKFTFRVHTHNKKTVIWVCANAVCSWKVRTTPPTDLFTLVQLLVDEATHTCIGLGPAKFSSSAKRAWLDRVVPQHLNITSKTKPQEIVDLLRVQFAETIDYQRAQRCRLRLLEDTIEAQRGSFYLLPGYLQQLSEAVPGLNYRLLTDDRDRFHRVFICLPQSNTSFETFWLFMSVDGTFMKSRFTLIILFAVGIDANGEIYLLAWAIVEAETESSWSWFFRQLQQALPSLVDRPTTIMSNRDKGLITGLNELGPSIIPACCCFHLKTNFVNQFKIAYAKAFWLIARAKTIPVYDAALDELRQSKPEAADYLINAMPELWAQAHFPGQRFGHDSSNIVESLNQVLRYDRELPIVPLLDAIWHSVMKSRFDRHDRAIKARESGHQFTPLAEVEIMRERASAATNVVQQSSPTEARVVDAQRQIFIVNLQLKTCTCGSYQTNNIPCQHAMKFIHSMRMPVEDHLPMALSTLTWALQFEEPLPPLDTTGLARDPAHICAPPAARTPRGRPRKERFRKEDRRRTRMPEFENGGGIEPPGPGEENAQGARRVGAQRCGSCGEAGHNARRCRKPHS